MVSEMSGLNTLRKATDVGGSAPVVVPQVKYAKPAQAEKLTVLVTGGIGDCVISLSIIRQLHKLNTGTIHIYSRYPQVFKYFLKGIPIETFKEEEMASFDSFLVINSIAKFVFNPWFNGFRNDEVEKLFYQWKDKVINEKWMAFLEKHPAHDNQMAKKAVSVGLTRATLPHHLLSLPYEPVFKTVNQIWRVGPYVTLNDGAEARQLTGERTTKNWPMDNWNHLCKSLLRKYPTLNIVQLGGKETRKIEWATHDFRGILPLPDSFDVLSGSMLHIDSDSGLVHAAHSLGVQSIVLFGPTNKDFFGYEENVNLVGPGCEGDCWWLSRYWLQQCPLGYGRPKCLDSIQPDLVFAEAVGILKERLGT